jgi:glycosyltransferase involved in cell wall biosynthesis
MKKVLHIRCSGAVLGAEKVIIELCKWSRNMGYTVVAGAINDVADPYPEFLRIVEEEQIETIVFPCRTQFDLRCAWKIREFVRKANIDIVHTHGYKEDFFCILAGLKIPKIATNHLWKKCSRKNSFYTFLDSKFLRFFDYVVGVSDEIVAEMKLKKIYNVCKIENGVDLSMFAHRDKSEKFCKEFSFDESTIVIGMISSITKEKGHEFALQAFERVRKEHNNLKLLIIGDGKLTEEIKNMVVSLGLEEDVIFTGRRSEIAELLTIIDIFLLPSLAEGLPIALLEAMAAKKAVIATSVGGIPNLIETEKNGLLIKPQDVDDIVIAVRKFVDADKRKKCGENAYITIHERYSSEFMAQSYCKLYTDLIMTSNILKVNLNN